MNFLSPLEQFEINPIQPLSFFGLFDSTYTNSSHTILITVTTALLFLSFGIYRMKFVPSYYQSVVEMLYLFIVDIVKQQAGVKAVKYFPLIFTIFLFILFSNLIGLVPENFTSTSHIIVTFTLSLSFNMGFLMLGFLTHGLSYLWFFVPSGAPKALLPLIVVIEVVSYCLRPFSLAIRLFANMMAGHTLLYILSSFVIALGKTKYFVLGLLPFVLVAAVVFLEIGIAFLQAYVFAILLTIYLNDALNINH